MEIVMEMEMEMEMVLTNGLDRDVNADEEQAIQ